MASREKLPLRDEARGQLAAVFLRNGYVRRQNTARFTEEGSQAYKKGDEVRLILPSKEEAGRVRQWLKLAGFRHGRSFRKTNQICIPLYGREQTARFLSMVAEFK